MLKENIFFVYFVVTCAIWNCWLINVVLPVICVPLLHTAHGIMRVVRGARDVKVCIRGNKEKEWWQALDFSKTEQLTYFLKFNGRVIITPHSKSLAGESEH